MRVPARLRKDVTAETLDAIAASVDRAESETSGEIVVHIAHSLLPLERARDRAIRAFRRLGVHKTKRRNGVLLFVTMKRRRFEIVADEGIDRVVDAKTWVEIAKGMEKQIEHDGFERGICAGVEAIGALLKERFPREPDDVNELPDRPVVSPDSE
jgi:uncharacterized membrane protein